MPRRNAERREGHEPAVARRAAAERTARGWSLATMAEQLTYAGCPIHPSAVHRIETGTRKISVDELVALSAVFDVPIPELIDPTGGLYAKMRRAREEALEAERLVRRLEDELRTARARLAQAEAERCSQEVALHHAQIGTSGGGDFGPSVPPVEPGGDLTVPAPEEVAR